MRYKKIKSLSEADFRRLTGIKQKTFDKMVKILAAAREARKSKGGKPNKLSVEDSLLMALEYLREYRTYFHISQSYDLSESACYRNIKWVEDTLIKSKEFSLPGRKALVKSDNHFEVILVDATESPIERPKKNQKQFFSGKKNDTHLKAK